MRYGALRAPYRTLSKPPSARMPELGETRRHQTLWQAWLLVLSASCAAQPIVAAHPALSQTAPDHLQPAQYAAAARAYHSACEAGSAQACGYLGFMYDNGFGVRSDMHEAVALSERGCNAGGAFGCAYLGYLFQLGRGVATDATRAAALFRKACDGSDTSGCLLLGIMYKTGAGVPEDAEYAVQLFGKACDDGEPLACVSLGYMYANGEGVDADKLRAAELFRSACAQADEIGCQAKQQLESRLPVP
jgi:TPR repeat protein